MITANFYFTEQTRAEELWQGQSEIALMRSKIHCNFPT